MTVEKCGRQLLSCFLVPPLVMRMPCSGDVMRPALSARDHMVGMHMSCHKANIALRAGVQFADVY